MNQGFKKITSALTPVLTVMMSLTGPQALAGNQRGQTQAAASSSQQNVQIYFGTLTSDKGSCDVSNVQMNISRVDYYTNKGWRSASGSRSVTFQKGHQDDAGQALNDVEGLSAINVVLNKNNCGRIQDNRGHQCIIKDQTVSIPFKSKISFGRYDNNKLRLFLDLRNSSFEYNKDGSCVFKPNFQVVHSGHNKTCLDNNSRGGRDFMGRYVASSRSQNSKHGKCSGGWDHQQNDDDSAECQEHHEVPTNCPGHGGGGNGGGNHGGGNPTPTPTPIVVVPTPTPIIVKPTPTPIVVVPTPTPIIVKPTPTPIVVVPTPTPIVVIPTPTPIVVVPTPTPVVVQPTPTPVVVVPTPTPVVVEPTPTPIVVVPTPTPVVVEPTPTPVVVEPTPTPIVVVPTPSPTPVVVEPTPTPAPEPTPNPTPVVIAGPVISGFAILETFPNSVSVVWNTNVSSSSQVMVTNMTTGEQTLTNVDNTMVISHSAHVSNLEPGITYELRAVSVNADGGSTTSAALYFTP